MLRNDLEGLGSRIGRKAKDKLMGMIRTKVDKKWRESGKEIHRGKSGNYMNANQEGSEMGGSGGAKNRTQP